MVSLADDIKTPGACPVCGARRPDRFGALKHEAWCSHFMRGPDPGGDPYEWPRLTDIPDQRTED